MNESSTISVIERDNLTREMLSRWIDSAPGFRCVGGYADTRSALQHLSEENPDLILVDLHLPGAIEYVRHLKPLLPGTESTLVPTPSVPMKELRSSSARSLGRQKAFA